MGMWSDDGDGGVTRLPNGAWRAVRGAAQAVFAQEERARQWLDLAARSAEPPDTLAGLLRGRVGLPAAPLLLATTVVIIDDDPCARQVLRIVLSDRRQWEVVGEAADGHEGIVVVGRLRPQLAVLDVHMPTLDGLAAVSALRAASPCTRIVLHSSTPAAELASSGMPYVGKATDPDRLPAAFAAALAS